MLKQAFLLLVCALAWASPLDDKLVEAGSQKLESGDVEGALADFREALALDGKLASVRNELATVLAQKKRYADAVSELKQAVAAQPDLVESWYNLGQNYAALKRCDEASDAYNHAIKLAPSDPDSYINLSVLERKCHRAEASRAAGAQAVKMAPSNPQARLNLGLALEALGKLDEAQAAFKVATELKPDYGTAWWSLGLCEHKRGKLADAALALEKARRFGGGAARTSDLGRVYRDQGDFTRAISLFREALGEDPAYTPARFYLAQTLSAAGKCSEMKAELARLPKADQNSEPTRKLMAGCKSK